MAISFASPARAGVIADCYAGAETVYPGLSVSVKLGSTTVLTSSDLDAVFDKIAEHHDAANLDLGYNADGKNAMKSAMDCIFDAEYLTLSGVVTNERFSDLRVRNYTVTAYDSTPAVTGRFRFEHADATSCVGDPMIFFEEVAGKRAFAITTLAYGTHDLGKRVTSDDLDNPCIPNGPCFGRCAGECDPDTGASTCFCTGPGDCDRRPNSFGGPGFNAYNVFTVTE